jgi:hypothetical protein
MSYLVTSGASENGVPSTVDRGRPGVPLELADALTHACRLIDQQVPNVAIMDENGNSISGDELISCCKGDKEITADLRAVAVPD